jgi:hypothetical protein
VRIPPFSPLAAALCLLVAVAARADEWVAERTVSARIVHNDNINMQPGNQTADTYLTLTPSLTLSGRTEARDASVALATTVNRYFDRPEYNTVGYRANVNLKWATELDQRSLTLASARDSTLASELATTGVVLARRQRTMSSAQAAWQRSLSEKTSVNAALSLTAVKYEPAPGLVDYNDQSVSTGLRQVLSERASVGAALSKREYRTVAGDVRSGVNAVSISGQMKYSERLSLSVDAGKDRTRTELNLKRTVSSCPTVASFVLLDANSVPLACFDALFTPVPLQKTDIPVSLTSHIGGTTFNGSASYLLESGAVSASVGRNLNASGTGSLLRSDQASFSYQHRFSEALEFALSAGVVRSSALGDTTSETRFTRLSPSLQWQLDQWVSLSFGLSHSTQIASGQPQAAKSNMAFIGLNYGFRPLSVSR